MLSSLLALVTTISRAVFLEEPIRSTIGGEGARFSGGRSPGFIEIYVKNLKELLRLYKLNPVLKALSIVTPINGLAALSPGSYIVILYLSDYMGISTIALALALFLRTIVENQIALLYGAIADRLGPLRSVAVSWTASSAMQLVMIAIPSDIIAISSYISWVAATKLAEISLTSLMARSLDRGMKASALASIGTLSGLSLIPAPMIEAVVYGLDPRLPFIFSAISLLISKIILIRSISSRPP